MRSDLSLFTRKVGKHRFIVAISMDDFLPSATDKKLIDDLYNALSMKCTVKHMGRSTSYLN